MTLHLGCVYNTTVSTPHPFFGPEGHESMGSDRVVGPLFVHPLCGYGAKRLCSRSPAYPCPPGPLYGPGTWSFLSSHGVDGYHRPAPQVGIGCDCLTQHTLCAGASLFSVAPYWGRLWCPFMGVTVLLARASPGWGDQRASRVHPIRSGFCPGSHGGVPMCSVRP